MPSSSTLDVELAAEGTGARQAVEILLAPTAWRVTDAVTQRDGRWIRVARH